jgi:hypothetical protein
MRRMAGRPFDRDIFRSLEGFTEVDLNRTTGEGANAGLMHLLRSVGGPQATLANTDTLASFFGFYGAGFLVTPLSPATTTVRILAGLGAKRDDGDLPHDIAGVAGLSELSDVKPIVLRDHKDVPVPVPPASPNSRYDIIEVALRRDVYDVNATAFLSLPAGSRVDLPVSKTLSYALDTLPVGYVTDPTNSTQPIGYKIGQASATPSPPPTSPGYVKIAQILVQNVVDNPTGTIRQEHIADFRPMLFLGGSASFSVSCSFELAGGVPTILHAAVPPGIRVAVARGPFVPGPAIPDFYFFVLNNLRDCEMTVQSPLLGAINPTTTFQFVRGEQLPNSVVNGSLKTLIDDPTVTFPAQAAPLLQPVFALYGIVTNWTGITFADSADATLYYSVRGEMT